MIFSVIKQTHIRCIKYIFLVVIVKQFCSCYKKQEMINLIKQALLTREGERFTGEHIFLPALPGKKNAHPINQMSNNIVEYKYQSLKSDLSASVLPEMELAPFQNKILIGCQGVCGPLPSAFLDK